MMEKDGDEETDGGGGQQSNNITNNTQENNNREKAMETDDQAGKCSERSPENNGNNSPSHCSEMKDTLSTIINANTAESNSEVDSSAEKDDGDDSDSANSDDSNSGDGDSDSDNSGNGSNSDGDEKEEEEKVPTDEYGRELSAYEIMRLERIKRNQAYLAGLGLEEEKKRANQAKRKEIEEKRKERKKNNEETPMLERRKSMARKSKTKEVDYSGGLKNVLEPKIKKKDKKRDKAKDMDKMKRPREEKKKKRAEQLPRFIYLEFEHIKKCRNKAVTTGKRLVKAAEVEVRVAKKNLEIHEKREKRRQEKEERRQLLESKRLLEPLVKELDARRVELQKAWKEFDAWDQRVSSNLSQNDTEFKLAWQKAKAALPVSIGKKEHMLGTMLHDRLCPESDDKRKIKRKRGRKKKGDKNKVEENDKSSPGAQILIEPVLKKKDSETQFQFSATNAPLAKKSNQQVKARNVGGPVTPRLAKSVQRKWLEREIPVPAEISTQYLPQVGDVVLYYPRAHYDFLKDQPDIRQKKLRLKLRKPLWEKAEEELELLKESKEKNPEEQSKKVKMLHEEKWWTPDWIKSVPEEAGAYPIICRVEKTIAEFPYDAESLLEIRRLQYKAKKEGKVKEQDKLKKKSSRRLVTRTKPILGVCVTLKPLSPIIPPQRSRKMGIFFEECSLSLPPTFSVLTFPCSTEPFIVPFFHAYRLSLSISDNERVKILEKDATQKQATVSSQRNHQDLNSTALEMFTEIVQKDTHADHSTLHRLDNFISKCYDVDENSLNKLLPETELRAIVTVALYQCHKRKITLSENESMGNNNGTNVQSSQIEDDGVSSFNIGNFMSWIQLTLPRWKGVKLTLDETESEAECFKSAWEFTTAEGKDHKDSSEILAAALTPSVLMTSPSANNGGFIYSLHNDLRSKIEKAISDFMENSDEVTVFARDPDQKTAPEYNRFVPVSMSFRRILRRLKMNHMKNSKHNHDAGDPIENKSIGHSSACYYRSVGAIQADITDIYQNCLIYNDPQSEIVQNALEITNILKAEISDIEKQWQVKTRDESIQSRLAELAAWGEEDQADFSATTISDVRTESFEERFKSSISPKYCCMKDSMTEKDSNSPWVPQGGDKIIYNRQLHGKFINDHFSFLSKEERVLPSILPRKKAASPENQNALSEVPSSSNDKTKYHSWLGTVSSVRFCFPPKITDNARVFDKEAPMLAIGIRFHYNWLKDIHTVYFRLCKSNQISDGTSFIIPAWTGQMDKLLPPYPMSLVEEKHLPKGIPYKRMKRIEICMAALKERILKTTQLTSFGQEKEAGTKSVQQSGVDHRFYQIFENEPIYKTSAFVDNSTEYRGALDSKLLHDAAFLPPWTPDNHRNCNVVTTRRNNPNRLVEGLVANPYLCLDLIEQRIKNNYYHGLDSAAHDIREAFVCTVFYVIKEQIFKKQIDKKIAIDLIKRLKDSSSESRQEKDQGVINGQSQALGNMEYDNILDVSNLSRQHAELLRRIDLIRKVHVIALICLLETSMIEYALGIDNKDDTAIPEVGPTEGQRRTKKTLSKILSSLSHDRCNFRKPLPKASQLPTMKVRVLPPTKDTSKVKESHEFKESIILKPDDFHETTKIVSSLFQYEIEKSINVRVTCDRKSSKKTITFKPKDYVSNLSLQRVISKPTRQSVQVTIKFNEYTSPTSNCEKDVLRRDEIEESDEEEKTDFSKCIVFHPDDYVNSDDVIRALFCRPKRNKICARCKLGRNGLFTCRVRKAHSNLSFVWTEFLKNAGGVDGILKHLKSSSSSEEDTVSNKSENQPTITNSNSVCSHYDREISTNESCQDDIALDASNQLKDISHHTEENEEEQDEILISSTSKVSYHDLLTEAEELLRQARHSLDMAVEDQSSKVCLSEVFLNSCDLLDPNDGHYEICNICGLGGDVLCCESCPNVAHAKCVGLETIPNGPWYCEKCLKERNGVPERKRPDFVKLEKKIEALRLMRQKDKHESRKGDANGKDETNGVEEAYSTANVDEGKKHIDIILGMKLVKRSLFEQIGEVVGLPSFNRAFYEVKYDDGEIEFLDYDEVLEGVDSLRNLVENDVFVEVQNNKGQPIFIRRKRQRKSLERYGSGSIEIPSTPDAKSEEMSNDPPKDLASKKKKRGRPKKIVQNITDQQEQSPQVSDQDGTAQKRKRGRPRKMNHNSDDKPISLNTQESRKRGRPTITKQEAKSQHQTNSGQPRGRGRPRKIVQDSNTVHTSRKGGGKTMKRGRPRKISRKIPIGVESLNWLPNPGFVDPSMTYYCTVENDTSATIARKVGLEWIDVANEEENKVRFPSLQNKRIRFRKGTLVRVPPGCDLDTVTKLRE